MEYKIEYRMWYRWFVFGRGEFWTDNMVMEYYKKKGTIITKLVGKVGSNHKYRHQKKKICITTAVLLLNPLKSDMVLNITITS